MWQCPRNDAATRRRSRDRGRGSRLTAVAIAISVTVAVLGSKSAATGECPPPRSAPPGPALWLSDEVIGAGAAATITVNLAAGSSQIAALESDLAFPASAPIAAKANGRPDCTVNLDINKGATSFGFLPVNCSGAACTTVRAIVISFDDSNPIADGSVLFTCSLNVDASASGRLDYTFSGTILSDPGGAKVLDSGDQDGELCVATAPPPRCPTPRPGPSGPAIWIPDQTALPVPSAITVRLANDPTEIAALESDLTFPVTAPIAAKANGKPDCTVNPDIDKNATTFGFRPPGCSGSACTTMRVIVLAIDNTNAIPVGSPLFTCNIDSSAGITGILDYVFMDTVLSDPSGHKVPDAGDQDGRICVDDGGPGPTATPTASPTWTPSPSPTPTPACSGDCGGIAQVTVADVITLVNIALGNEPPSACSHGIPSGSVADISLIIQAVGHALNDCPS